MRSSNKRIKGIIHCHTEMSYDGSISLEDLCRTLKERGFSFVAVTDHVKGVTAGEYNRFVDACQKLSSESFVVIPGLELLLDNGDEIAAIGINEFISSTSLMEVLEQIHLQGGYAIWAHPHKRRQYDLNTCVCDAVEILNGKVDGTTAPNLSLFFKACKLLRAGKRIHLIFGADLHDFQETLSVWTECEVTSLSDTEILRALIGGRYSNYVARIEIPSNGKIAPFTYILLLFFRVTYLAWNIILDAMPDNLRKWAVRVSRGFISLLKTDGHRNKV